jgi:hypothetical protein
VRVERLMDDATRALAARDAPSKPAGSQGAAVERPGTVASASEPPSTAQNRGN